MHGDLYLGFDLSTQQLKVSVIDSKLEPFVEENVVFDHDLPHYNVTKGVHTDPTQGSVYAPVAMWIEALDIIFRRMKEKQFDFSRVKAISGAGQQHGSVYWSETSQDILKKLDSQKPLVDQLFPSAFSHPWSPNWQDHSTALECDMFEKSVGGPEALAERTGSKAHHRFTGPQILRLKRTFPEVYNATKRITLVSSFLASILLGDFAPFDISDVCGMNLWNLQNNEWDPELLDTAVGGGKEEAQILREKLGPVEQDGGKALGIISTYFIERYGFCKDCLITTFTGDNPATILALPLRPLDVIVSLGTSTTLLMSTPTYVPSAAYHLFNHPTEPGLYMFMLCYCNGSLAREHIRDQVNSSTVGVDDIHVKANPWSLFNKIAASTPPLGRSKPSDPAKIGFYFPLPEIVPSVPSGTWRFTYETSTKSLNRTSSSWTLPQDDARAILESQALSMRLRSEPLLLPTETNDHKRQPRRIYVVGGASKNTVICNAIGQVLGGAEGVYRLDVGANACALGAAYKACWAVERRTQKGRRYEDFLELLWKEQGKIVKVAQGYEENVWKGYGEVLLGFKKAEELIMQEQRN